MIKNYLKIAFRNMVGNPVHSIINITGLSLGIAVCILISLWVWDELSFDRFNKNADSIFRLVATNPHIEAPMTPPPLAPKIREDIPEVVNSARYLPTESYIMQYGEKSFTEANGILADSSLFSIFSFPFAKGTPQAAFADPASIMISKSMAARYFGEEDPMDKMLELKGSGQLRVSGVFEDIPHNSHLQFDYVIPVQILTYIGMNLEDWGNYYFTTYVQLQHEGDLRNVGDKITQIQIKASGAQDASLQYQLQPLKKIHFSSGLQYEKAIVGDVRYVYIFSIAAFLILFIACINYINLIMARAGIRFKEAGLRKTIGAGKWQLFGQHLIESILYIATATMLSAVLVTILLPLFNQLSGKSLVINFFHYQMIIGGGILIIFIALIAEIYPAWHLTMINSTRALIGSKREIKAEAFRKVLILFQFAISIFLIIATMFISRQVSFMQESSPGFDKEGIVYVHFKSGMLDRYQTLKSNLLQRSEVVAVTANSSMPTGVYSAVIAKENGNANDGLDWEGRTGAEALKLEYAFVDHEYFSTMGMEIVEGRDFSRQVESDAHEAFILNEAAVRQLQMNDPVGKWLFVGGRRGRIVGVFKDAHFRSLQQSIPPQAFLLMTPENQSIGQGQVVLIKAAGDMSTAIEAIRSEWDKVFPDIPFEYSFLDQAIAQLYQSERRVKAIFNYFTMLAIVLSCLGLFGMSLFMIQQKTKEIGIRKVNGAKTWEVMSLLNKDFVKWVAIAFVIASPIAWYAMNKWLENFAYKTELSLWIFALAGMLALGIALLTVSYQSWKAANRNPIESLRYE